MKKFLLTFILGSVALFAFSKTHTLHLDGVKRAYYLHMPKNISPNTKTPLIIFLHGGGQKVKKMARNSTLNQLADKHGFMVLYPVGIDKHWNDGRGITYKGTHSAKVDDVKFIKRLIGHIKKTYPINKVYVTGLSNGGLMTYRLGCEIANELSAIAPTIANIPARIIKTCQPQKALSVLIMNGTDDPIVPWNGGSMRLFKKSMGEVVSTQESVSFWRKQNRCRSKSNTKVFPNLNKKDKSSVTSTRYTQCKNNTEVILYTIQGGGHTLPGKKGFNMPRLVGAKNRDIEGMHVIVDFLLKH